MEPNRRDRDDRSMILGMHARVPRLRSASLLPLQGSLVALLVACSGGSTTTRPRDAPSPPAGQEMRYAAVVEVLSARSRAVVREPVETLLVGSSIFRRWSSAATDLRDADLVNHGFGGSRTWELVEYVEELVVDFSPEVVVCYCGSNDVNAGASAAAIARRVEIFMETVEDALPGVGIVYVAINRAPQKRDRWTIVDEANQRIEKACRKGPNRVFVDVNEGLFDARDSPRTELYLEDGLHFRPAAYREVFGPAVRNAIERVRASSRG
ncbi:MAG: hypothetical protein GY921_08485 [Phycisphaeraceae bacterium]|nr:hypothetical protein [Phycisphaeraceae bacterium]